MENKIITKILGKKRGEIHGASGAPSSIRRYLRHPLPLLRAPCWDLIEARRHSMRAPEEGSPVSSRTRCVLRHGEVTKPAPQHVACSDEGSSLGAPSVTVCSGERSSTGSSLLVVRPPHMDHKD